MRFFILATVGKKLERYKKPVLLGIGLLMVVYILLKIIHH